MLIKSVRLLELALFSFCVGRVLRSRGKPATRKRYVLFRGCDGWCRDGTKINGLAHLGSKAVNQRLNEIV